MALYSVGGIMVRSPDFFCDDDPSGRRGDSTGQAKTDSSSFQMVARVAFASMVKLPRIPPSPAVTAWHAPSLVTKRLVTMCSTPDVVTLDCTGTIMRVKGSMPRLYLGVLEDRLGVKEGTIPGVCEDALMDSFRSSLKQRSKELPCFGSGVLSSEEWWADVVRATFRGAGVPQESMEGVFDEVFDQLFHQVFTGELAWELVPGAKDVIRDLRTWCQEDQGPLALGVVSNFDERLHPLLKNLGVYDCFDFVLTSRECGSEKPDPYMFREALTRAGAQEASGVGVHVGDRFSKDVLGARGAGWAPVLITGRRDPSEEEERVEHIRVVKLTDVPAALGVKRR